MFLVELCIKKIIEKYKTLDSLRQYIRKESLPDELRETIIEYFVYYKVIDLEKFDHLYIYTFECNRIFDYLKYLWNNIPSGIIFRKDFDDTNKIHVTIYKQNNISPMVVINSWNKTTRFPSANIMWVQEGKIIIANLGLHAVGKVIAWKPSGNLSHVDFSCSRENNRYLVTLRTHPEFYIIIDPSENILDINVKKLSNVKYNFRRTDKGQLTPIYQLRES